MGGDPQSVLISRVCLKQGQSSVSLLINGPWCQVSCKSDLFQIPSRLFPLLIQCLRYAFETWFGKIASVPGKLCQRATTTEPVGPRACDLHQEKHRIEKPVHYHYRVAPARCKWRSSEQQYRPSAAKIKKKKERKKERNLPEKPVRSQQKQDMKKDETSLGLYHASRGEGSKSLFSL